MVRLAALVFLAGTSAALAQAPVAATLPTTPATFAGALDPMLQVGVFDKEHSVTRRLLRPPIQPFDDGTAADTKIVCITLNDERAAGGYVVPGTYVDVFYRKQSLFGPVVLQLLANKKVLAVRSAQGFFRPKAKGNGKKKPAAPREQPQNSEPPRPEPLPQIEGISAILMELNSAELRQLRQAPLEAVMLVEPVIADDADRPVNDTAIVERLEDIFGEAVEQVLERAVSAVATQPNSQVVEVLRHDSLQTLRVDRRGTSAIQGSLTTAVPSVAAGASEPVTAP